MTLNWRTGFVGEAVSVRDGLRPVERSAMMAGNGRCCRTRGHDELPPSPENLGHALNLGLAEFVETVHAGDADVDFGGLTVGIS